MELVNYEDNITTTLPAEMEQKRSDHGCSLVTDANSVRSIVVAGGYSGGGLTSVVQLVLTGEDVTQWRWEKLADLPQATYNDALVPTIDNTGVRLFGDAAGGDKVLQLKPATNSSTWEEVPGISFENQLHQAVPILAC